MNASQQLETPVVIMVFNRPEKTRRVFEAIRRARPKQLLIIADGARNAAEAERCSEVRTIIENGIDWPCIVSKNYSEINLRPKKRISSGLDWVFSLVEEAIILEDDCLPDPSFFPFCQELLTRYRDDSRIMQVSGYNFAARNTKFKISESYYFSNIGVILGWATWRRAWKNYDVNIMNWPEIKKSNLLLTTLGDAAIVDHYNHLFDDYYAQKVDSWDSQWFLTRWIHNGLSVVPATNLVQNIGFDSESTNTAIDPNDARAHVPVISMTFPLIHPTIITPKTEFDAYVFRYQLSINRFFTQRILWLLKKSFPRLHGLLKDLKATFKKRRG